MNGKVYNLMNWPEIEGITYCESDKPGELLGGHLVKEGFLIQIFRPDAVDVKVSVSGVNKKYTCDKVDEAGYFAVLIPGKKKVEYTVRVEDVKGRSTEYIDPYCFGTTLKKEDIKKFLSGTSEDSYKFMGARQIEVDGISGVRFAVYAPNARRVSVVGAFNDWDGRSFQMNRNDESGIFELFIPGLEDASDYCYEIKLSNGQIVRKADPYYIGDNDLICDFIWNDEDWKPDTDKDKPLAICELGIDELTSDDIVRSVKNMGFSYVELSGLTSTIDKENGIAAGNFCIDRKLGSDRLKGIINEFHNQGIGVIIDCNMAYMEEGLGSFIYYDGTHLLDSGSSFLSNHPDIKCALYNFDSTEVRSYLNSTAVYWIKEFHADGLRLKEVASMLYLDYGRNPGEWSFNIYGSKENLAGVEFIKGLRKIADKQDKKVLLIAEESSIWDMVTGDIKREGLGFDYKWNDGWKKDFMDFYYTDPLFRKGKYDKLSHSMLYQYSEDFILEFSRDGFGWEKGLLKDAAPVPEDKKISHVKNALAYMYAYPGKKLVNFRECEGLEDYVAWLNGIYSSNTPLYQLDNKAEGFGWINDSAAVETILSFYRKAADGTMIMAIANFTPVDRKGYVLGVPQSGKYTDMVSAEVYKSTDQESDGFEDSIKADLPGLCVSFFTFEPYTEIEVQENAIMKETRIALEEAKKKALDAKIIETEAKETARAAAEARDIALKAAKEAAKASEYATKQAEAAKLKCQQIEAEAKKKLAALRGKTDIGR